MRNTLLVAAVALGITLGSGTATAVPKPAQDPFYAIPAGLSAHADGDVLASRPITPLMLGVPLAAQAWHVQYKSLDGANQPTTGVATVLVPNDPWPGPGPRPLLAYQTAEDSLGTRCDASYAFRAGLQAGIANPQGEIPMVAAALTRGWAVVVADYQGPNARFLDGRQSGHSVLDAIRATLRFTPAGIAKDAPLGAWGYSGGAFASGWAAELAPSYAPELRFAGIALGGIPADMNGAFGAVNRTANAGLGVLAIVAAVRNNPDLDVAGVLNDRGKALVTDNATACGNEVVARYANQDLNQFSAVPNLLADTTFQTAIGRNTLGRATPTAPIYAYHSVTDDVLPVAGFDALVGKYCAAGVTVERVHSNVPSHLVAALTGMPGAMEYLGDRFAGRPAPVTC